MKFVDEYRDSGLVRAIAGRLRQISKKKITIMEVCGGHTMSIHRFGLQALIPGNIKLVSGPGCPVCVSSQGYIDRAIALSRLPGVIITTYGDMIRVPGTTSSLEKERAMGADVRIVYSVLDSVALARQHPGSEVIFLGIGFETTAPATAAAVSLASEEKLANFTVFSAHKVMPPVMEALVKDEIKINGFIAPGHVSAITGTSIYNNLAEKHGLGVVITGFEPADLMQAILMLAVQAEESTPRVEIQYNRVVSENGNIHARKVMEEVFEPRDDYWRGLGMIPLSGLGISSGYAAYDSEKRFSVDVPPSAEPKGCICGSVLKGISTPADCRLFAAACTPDNPVGPCMVSAEGTCATYYKFRDR